MRDSGNQIILYGRLYTNFEFLIKSVNTFAEAKIDSIFSEGNEVIVPASGESPLEIARASAIESKGIIIGGDLNIIKPNMELNPSFLALMFTFGKQNKMIANMAQGKSVVHLQNSSIKKVQVEYPNIEEQIKFINNFSALDNLITLHQRELDILKEMKKTLLKNMFV